MNYAHMHALHMCMCFQPGLPMSKDNAAVALEAAGAEDVHQAIKIKVGDS